MTDDTITYFRNQSTQLAESLERERSRANDLERTIDSVRSEQIWMLPVIIIVTSLGSGSDSSWQDRVSDAIVHGSMMTAWLIWISQLASTDLAKKIFKKLFGRKS